MLLQLLNAVDTLLPTVFDGQSHTFEELSRSCEYWLEKRTLNILMEAVIQRFSSKKIFHKVSENF